MPCPCAETHESRRVVLTGGPGAGKTAVLEMVRKTLCHHVRVLPEAAGVVFGGGFPRHGDRTCRRAAQRAIFHVQRQLEVTGEAHDAAMILCDRGTIDGLAYWPGSPDDLWTSAGTTLEDEIARYGAVIHLRTPESSHGYNWDNPLRTESAAAAAEIDQRILQAWEQHPRRYVVEAHRDFIDKAADTLAILGRELPDCCTEHLASALRVRISR